MRGRIIEVTALCLPLLWPIAGQTQDRAQTLADIRQELNVLFVEIQKLRRELNTTGSPQVNTGGGSVLDRVNTIEAELQRLTNTTEELQFRIDRIVADGTNRIGDLEFRLCELEEGCDIGQLAEGTTLGGPIPEGAASVPTPVPAPADVPQLASNEQADFERAQASLDAGEFAVAAEQFALFNQTYPGGPLAVAAEMRRGEALEGIGDTRAAARAYLDAFGLDEDGPLAGEALFRLGLALEQLGKADEACVMLGEVGLRFPNDVTVTQAQDEMQRIGCG